MKSLKECTKIKKDYIKEEGKGRITRRLKERINGTNIK